MLVSQGLSIIGIAGSRAPLAWKSVSPVRQSRTHVGGHRGNNGGVHPCSTVAPALQADKTELSLLGLYEPKPVCLLEGSLIPGCPQDLVTS